MPCSPLLSACTWAPVHTLALKGAPHPGKELQKGFSKFGGLDNHTGQSPVYKLLLCYPIMSHPPPAVPPQSVVISGQGLLMTPGGGCHLGALPGYPGGGQDSGGLVSLTGLLGFPQRSLFLCAPM